MRGKETLWKQTTKLPLLILFMAVFLWGGVPRVNAADAFTGEATQLPTITITPYIDNEEYTWQYLPLEIDSKHTLSVVAVASDGSTPTYVWKDKDGNPIESESSNALEITKGIGDESYSVEVTTESGGFEICSFFLNSEETLQVTQWIGDEQTSHAACQVGESVTFRVQAESSYEGHVLTYQWKDGNGHNIETANGEKYTITKEKIGEEYYACEVSDGNYTGYYTFSVDSGETLTINKLLINNQEYRQWDYFACTEDGPYTLKVEAVTSLDNIQYQWYGRNEIGSHAPIDGATGPELTVDRPTGSELYYCWIFDGNKSETANFYLDLGDTLTIKQFVDGHPYNGYSTLECEAGEEFPLEVQAETTTENTLAYEWYYYDSDWTYHDIEEESNVCQVLMEAGERTYTCTVYDGNKRESVQFRLKTPNTLSVSQYINGKKESSGYFKNNDEIKLEVKAESSSGRDITYQWYQSDWDDENAILSGEKSSIYETTKNATTGDVYCCKVTDGLFTKRCVFYIDSEYTLSVTGYLNDGEYDSGYRFSQGEKITLRVEATSSENNDVEYEWYQEVDGDLTKLQTI